MGVSVKQILAVYGYGIIQDCFGLLKSLRENSFSHADFLEFVEKIKNQDQEVYKKEIKKIKKNREQKKVEEPQNSKPFLKTGEIEKMEGVRCEKCRGEVYIESICSTNPMVKQGYVRKGICGTCGIEFGIR